MYREIIMLITVFISLMIIRSKDVLGYYLAKKIYHKYMLEKED